jgi:hypothetical protein
MGEIVMHRCRVMLVTGLLFIALGGVVEFARATDAAVESETIPLQKYMGVLRALDVTVGAETVPFIFDTAGGLTFVTPEFARRHGCQAYGRVVGFRMSGEQLSFPRCGQMTLGLGRRQHVVETAVFDIMALLPEGWPEVGGIVSLHTFKDSAITIELGANRVTVESDESLAQRTADMRALKTRINTQTGGEGLDLFVEAAAEKGSLWLEVDSGNMGPVVLAPHAFDQLGAPRPGTDGGELELTLVGLDPIPVAVTEEQIIYDGVVNARTLEGLVLTIDLRTGQSWALPFRQAQSEAEVK